VSDFEAVVMAAGRGTRLRPLTERYAKAVLPIDGVPVLALVLRELAAAGIVRAWIVTGHLGEQIEALVGDGSAFGLDTQYVSQPVADGAGDAVRRALQAGARPPLVVSAADTRFGAGDVARLVAGAAGADGGLAVRRRPEPGPEQPAVRVAEGRVERFVDDHPNNRFSAAPLWVLQPPLVPFLDDLPGPPFELAVGLQRAVDAGLRVAAVEIGATRDLTTPFDLLEENFPYLAALR
jgi:dTDP-glucose pyrophosphorylase